MTNKKSNSGTGSMLLLAGLGVGAFLLFGNKAGAQSRPADAPGSDTGTDAGIPAAPNIVAINTSSTESPLPTGIVSDEEGMEPVTTSSGGSVSPQPAPGPETDTYGGAGGQPNSVPPLVSTRLTPKEKTIIDQGVLSDDLAIQRPDLYRAIYIRKHGGGQKGRQALQAANASIRQIQQKQRSGGSLAQLKRRKLALQLNPNVRQMVTVAAGQGKSTTTAPQTTGAPGQKTQKGKIVPSRHKPKPSRKVAHPSRKPAVRKKR